MVIIHIANIDISVIGGVQIAVPKMVKAQSKYADVCVLNTCGNLIDGVQTIKYSGCFDISKFPKPYNRPDIVVFHEVYRWEYIAIYKKLVTLGIPFVIIPHGCLSVRAQHKKKIKKLIANICFFDKFIKKACLVQYLSENEQVMSAFKKSPYLVLGNGVSLQREKKSYFNSLNPKFVYIGRLDVYIKGLDILLTAIKSNEVLLRQYGAKFEIYGPDYGGSHELLTRMIRKLSIEDLVQIDKEKIGNEKQKILLMADCFIQTSRTEGLPLGPLEALSYGVPCIVTSGCGLGKIINLYSAGYQSENTVDGVSKSIETFIQNLDTLEIMSQAAIQLIEENYDIDVIAKQTVDRYYNMLN